MYALVMMLLNTKGKTYHPIIYFSSPLPGGFEAEVNHKVLRYKSKGHRTVGFTNRDEAVNSIETEIVDRLKQMGGYTITKELDGDIEWDGEGIPADVQLRNHPAAPYCLNQ